MIGDTRIEYQDASLQGEDTRFVARTGVELSREARVRLHWMDFYRRCRNLARTCRHFGISRQTFYRWQRRYDPFDLTALEAASHRPIADASRLGLQTLEGEVLLLGLQFPRWGKDKLAVLLRQEMLSVSTSWWVVSSRSSNARTGW